MSQALTLLNQARSTHQAAQPWTHPSLSNNQNITPITTLLYSVQPRQAERLGSRILTKRVDKNAILLVIGLKNGDVFCILTNRNVTTLESLPG